MIIPKIQVLFLLFTLTGISSIGHAEPYEIEFPGNVALFYYEKEQTPLHSEPLFRVRVADKIMYVLPGVPRPSVHSAFLLEHTTIYAGEDVFDLGTGSGVQGVFAATQARKVISTDISDHSVENARLNARLHGVEHIVEVRQGDMFEPIKEDEKFDVILFNIEAPHNKKTQGLWKLHERFFKDVKKYLKPHGRIYYQSSIIDNIPRIQEMVVKNDLRIMKIDMVAAVKQHREPFVFLIQRKEPDRDVPDSQTK